ncbi:fumarylacetoacetate hydrolase family protein [Sphingomonas sp. AR_OL41]|uniref:fumarylacetoacetate hydrolase family protein n=1 Tax=Sphingomonas sp. AR_OL41 TaxID=3042729 RepID=UPI002480C3CA|nr:fumarylacetoacetate hydrolase family protein [Sphingomonas sp. AR_OL41]MDH7972108.1 fumarylacetoacetate hydrolase family protein [Sphingomonas sp. AR_OL41]
MALNVARVEAAGRVVWAVDSPHGLHRLFGDYPTTRAFFEQGGPDDAARAVTEGEAVIADRIMSPVTQDAQFICQATNYASHVKEVGGDPAVIVNNVIFTKAASCIVPADADIIRPPHVRLLDYEIELGLVLKRGFTGPEIITEATLANWIGGLVIVNDVTARDVQISHMQFNKSKSYRTFGPTGPWLVLPTAAELARWSELELVLAVEGEERQRSQAGDMIFKPAETLAELSCIMDLAPGDLIATGTPGGVALRPPSPTVQAIAGFLSPARRFAMFMKGQLKRPQYLRDGQVITASIRTPDGAIDLGQQQNRVRSVN